MDMRSCGFRFNRRLTRSCAFEETKSGKVRSRVRILEISSRWSVLWKGGLPTSIS